MNRLPNFLTILRVILLIPIMLLLTNAQDATTYQLAFGLFLMAALTDLLDGWAARHLNCVTPLGAFLDPLADKIMSNVLLIFLSCHYPSIIPLWMVLLLLAREFAVQGFRSMAACMGVMIRTELLSKLKTLFQLTAVAAVIISFGWGSFAGIANYIALISLILALTSGYLSMMMLFIRNTDLWSRRPLPMESR